MNQRRRILSGPEYDRRVAQLHEQLPDRTTARQRKKVRRAELDLMIDHKLGIDFPAERREALWQVQQQIERGRLRLLVAALIGKLISGVLPRCSHRLARSAVARYATVLDESELALFFGEEEMRDWREPG